MSTPHLLFQEIKNNTSFRLFCEIKITLYLCSIYGGKGLHPLSSFKRWKRTLHLWYSIIKKWALILSSFRREKRVLPLCIIRSWKRELARQDTMLKKSTKYMRLGDYRSNSLWQHCVCDLIYCTFNILENFELLWKKAL